MTDDPQDIGVRFAAQMLGFELADGPPPADSPLGRVLALTRALEELAVPESVLSAAIGAMWREEWKAQGLNVDSTESPWED
jgi:hypothetical protein